MTAPDQHVSDSLIAHARRAVVSHPNIFLARGRLVEVVADRDCTRLLPLRWSRISSLLGTNEEWRAYLKAEHEGRCPH